MSPQGIRLRVVVRRHAVPDVKLVWPCSATEDITVAKLLSQINEVVPLEGGEWGLEDYAVELADARGGTFECLHFQLVSHVLKEDDQVVIRSLLNEDLRRRRLGGRHQITTDGRHLVDGIAFGRSWVRPPKDRPALALPPRKRARITYDQEVDDGQAQDDEGEQEQLLIEAPPGVDTDQPGTVGVRALFDDADLDSDDEYDDEDFVGDDEIPLNEDADDEELDEADSNGQDLDEEIQLLRQDNNILGDDVDLPNDQLPTLESISANLGLDLESLDYITALRTAFPLTPVTAIEAELRRRGRDLRRTYNALAKLNDPTLSFDHMMDRAVIGLLDILAPEATPETSDLQVPSSPKRPLIEEVESFETVPNGASEVTTANVNASTSANDDAKMGSDNTSSSESSDSDSSSEDSGDHSEDSSDDSSDAEDDSPVKLVKGQNGIAGSSPGDESSSDASSDDSSESSNEDGGASVNNAAEGSEAEASSDASSDSDSSSSSSESESEPDEVTSKPPAQPTLALPPVIHQPLVSKPTPVLPGQGLSRTQRRNARRREAKNLEQLKHAPEADGKDSDSAELAARKAALLSAVNAETPEKANETQDKGDTEVSGDAGGQHEPAETPQDTPASQNDSSAQRRLRMDLGAGRRLLFGALGLKTPKSKADEDKIKQGLMKDVRPLKNPRTEPAETADTDMAEVDEDPDAWKEKITYRAVECCHEGMELSEPPFPFVQRWDPQQNFGSMRKRKRSSQNFDETYYEENYYDDSQINDSEQVVDNGGKKKNKSKKRKSKGGDGAFGDASNGDDNIVLNYDDTPSKTGAGSSQFTDMDDLPSLPSDVSTLPLLKVGEPESGMVITWKQWLLSKATGWQPQIASVTGLVLTGSDETTLRVVLAKRDREQDERLYDEETGARIYDRFEVPDEDGEDAEEDLGHRDVAWAEMVEPRLVQKAPVPDALNSPDKLVTDKGSAEISKGVAASESIKAAGTSGDGLQTGASAQDSKKGSKDEESSGSVSIQSGQQMPRLDLPTPGEDGSSHSNDWVADPRLASGGINSPTRQLLKTSQAAMTLDSKPGDGHSEAASPSQVLEPPDLPQDMDMDNDADHTPVVEHPMLTVPSSIGSPRSGRQPQSHYGDSLDQVHESVIPETVLQATPPPNNAQSTDASGSSSPFPSLEEIFHTAATTRQTQSPGKSQMSAIQTVKMTKRGGDYEEAMRRLDEGDESELSPDKNKSIRSLFPNATQPSPSIPAPTPSKRKTRAQRTSPFEIPEGSQVINLSSTPASPQPVGEVYAEDSIDDTYEGNKVLPKGVGSVKKSQPRRETRSRGKSAPAAKGKRKTSARFGAK